MNLLLLRTSVVLEPSALRRFSTAWRTMLLGCRDSVEQWLKAPRSAPLETPWPSSSTAMPPSQTVDSWLPTHLRKLQARSPLTPNLHRNTAPHFIQRLSVRTQILTPNRVEGQERPWSRTRLV